MSGGRTEDRHTHDVGVPLVTVATSDALGDASAVSVGSPLEGEVEGVFTAESTAEDALSAAFTTLPESTKTHHRHRDQPCLANYRTCPTKERWALSSRAAVRAKCVSGTRIAGKYVVRSEIEEMASAQRSQHQ